MSNDKSRAQMLANELLFHGRYAHETEGQWAFRTVQCKEAAAAELLRLDAVNRELLEALCGAEDSLEYVERVMPGKVGYGVRQERIAKARAAIAKATDV